jgi:hypothetical protein
VSPTGPSAGLSCRRYFVIEPLGLRIAAVLDDSAVTSRPPQEPTQAGRVILDCLPPTVGLDHVGAAGFQGGDCATIFVHCSGGHRLAKSDIFSGLGAPEGRQGPPWEAWSLSIMRAAPRVANSKPAACSRRHRQDQQGRPQMYAPLKDSARRKPARYPSNGGCPHSKWVPFFAPAGVSIPMGYKIRRTIRPSSAALASCASNHPNDALAMPRRSVGRWNPASR